MSNLNDQQFPRRWNPHDEPVPRERRCHGPGPFGAGCEEEGMSPSSPVFGNGRMRFLSGTPFSSWRDQPNKRLCINCASEAVHQRDYDEVKPLLDKVRKNGAGIDANVRVKPLWEPTAEDHNRKGKNLPWWTNS